MPTPPSLKPKLLLHICCAPCATYPFSVLEREYDVTAYFYDPNIHPESEHRARLDEAKKYFKDKCPLIEAPYEAAKWFDQTRGLEDEPEKGKRCTICYDLRITHAGEYAAKNGFSYFTTVLSVSPHKDATRIAAIGHRVGEQSGVTYLAIDWKKGGGFHTGVQMSRAAGLIRQDYCGCVYSLRDKLKRQHDTLRK